MINMKWYFHFNEFITLDDSEFGEQTFVTTPNINDKIVKNFMVPLQFVRMDINAPVYILSCYRPKFWEKKKGRDGSSQHCFDTDGACDVTSDDLLRLFTSLALGDNFNRITFYPKQRFFHIDLKGTERKYLIADPYWKSCSKDELIESIDSLTKP